MDALTPLIASWLADALLALHVGVVLFVVCGLAAILVGAWRRWAWTRSYRFRIAHLLLMAFIAVQAWLGRICPLTLWEQALRRHAGQIAHDGSFVEHWLSRLIFFEASWWIFVAAYTVFAVVVAACWLLLPPRRKWR